MIKNWSDTGIRRWSESDLGRLNWVLSTTLKPFIPIDREGWQITRPNLYSWYNPSVALQAQIWSTIQNWNMQRDGPHLLMVLFSHSKPAPILLGAENKTISTGINIEALGVLDIDKVENHL